MTLNVILAPLNAVMIKIVPVLLGLFYTVILLLIGWLIARVLEWIILTVLVAAKFDKGADRIGVADILEKGGIKLSASKLIATLLYWFVIFVAIVMAANILKLKGASLLLGAILGYIPAVLSAVFVLIIAAIIGVFLSSLVYVAAKNVGLESAKFISDLIKVAIGVFAFIIALGQLGVKFGWLLDSIAYIVAGVALALALAFGLGAKDVVASFLEELFG